MGIKCHFYVQEVIISFRGLFRYCFEELLKWNEFLFSIGADALVPSRCGFVGFFRCKFLTFYDLLNRPES